MKLFKNRLNSSIGMKIKYAKAVCLTAFYTLLVSVIYIGISKLFSCDISVDGLAMTVASSGILLHFIEKEDEK